MAGNFFAAKLFTPQNDVILIALKALYVNGLAYSIHIESNGATEMARHSAAYCLNFTALFDS
tara:strand:+ start:5418 stop:5603 length:186 start_codon:yes stop_codon:yes gene_type:complete